VSTVRVLIVDDNPCFRDAACALMLARGHVVVGTADSGSSALAALTLAPDVVLLDVCLGEESGFDVACALTRARPGIAVLLMSAGDIGVPEKRLSECGARGFTLKGQLARADLTRL
jgi:two-component system, NarL family, nitrate/nitrite response regulator NarL